MPPLRACDLIAAARLCRAAAVDVFLTVRAGNHRFWWLSALRAYTKAPYKMDFHKKTLRALNRPWAARTG
jgi:hypothetical protein